MLGFLGRVVTSVVLDGRFYQMLVRANEVREEAVDTLSKKTSTLVKFGKYTETLSDEPSIGIYLTQGEMLGRDCGDKMRGLMRVSSYGTRVSPTDFARGFLVRSSSMLML
jgi:hypothetical protein